MTDPLQQVLEPSLLGVVGAPAAPEAEIVELIRVLGKVVSLALHVLDAATATPGADSRMPYEQGFRHPDAGVHAGGMLAI